MYDIVFYISPEGVNIEDNGIRTTDPEYRTKIDMVIQAMLNEYPPNKLVKISGTTEQRIEQIKEALSL
jgi:nicotinamide riboside kinase